MSVSTRRGKAISPRSAAAAFFAVLALVMTSPRVAWSHGHHYIGTMTATGNAGGTVSSTTGQGVTGTEPSGVARAGGCAGAPRGFDSGYNARNGVPEPMGCVDVHTTTGSTAVNPLNPIVTISGSGYRPNTAFAVTYLFRNDPGDIDGDTEGQSSTDLNDPFCHRLYYTSLDGSPSETSQFIRARFVTNSSGSFGPVTVWLDRYEIGGGAGLGQGQLCISSQGFQYKGPSLDTTYAPTYQAQSVPICVGLDVTMCSRAQSSAPSQYVAFGDSLTTGYSIPECSDRPYENKNGCTGNNGVPTVTPYPDRVASALGMGASLNRMGIWGYTAVEASADAGRPYGNTKGGWEPQYKAVDKATTLVTGALGSNDMHFSEVEHWTYHCTDPWSFPKFNRANCQRHADADIRDGDVQGALDDMFTRLTNLVTPGNPVNPAYKAGLKVVIPLSYNPYANKLGCEMTYNVADVVVKTLNAELARRAAGTPIRLADTDAKFKDYGAGSGQSHVFGDKCEDTEGAGRGAVSWIAKYIFLSGDAGGIQRHYDPHPNRFGAQDIADAVVAKYREP